MIVTDPATQMLQLDRTVAAMNQALRNQVFANAQSVRPHFGQAWAAWLQLYKAARGNRQTVDAADAATRRVLAWCEAFRGEGIGARAAAGFEFLGTRIMTPSTISAELEKARTYFDQIDRDVQTPDAKQKAPADRNDWNLLHDEFFTWYNAKPSTLWGATADKADEYIKRATDFRDRFVKLGVPIHGTAAPGAPGGPSANDWKPIIEEVGGFALAALGLWALVKFLESRSASSRLPA